MALHIKKIICIFIFCLLCVGCGNSSNSVDPNTIGKYQTTYIIHYGTYYRKNIIISNDSIYTCSFQGTNFLLEKNNTEEILSTTAPIQIIKCEKIQ